MRLLVLGGTKFLGRHVVDIALHRAHDVTMFNRGVTNPGLFPEAEHLVGNRDGDLIALEGRSWDAVVDTCGYVPRIVRASAELLADAVGHYTFVSSGSVYAKSTERGRDETAPLETVDDERSEDVMAHYGALKALCERAVEEAMPGRALHIRAGLIVGPDDPTGRFTYWVHRIAQGGHVLATAPDQPVQFVDVRDLSGWILDLVEAARAGTFNATGPASHITMGGLLEDIRRVTGSDARFTWVDEEFLLERSVEPWSALPLWLALRANPGYWSFLTVDAGRAIGEGLRFRPLEDTVRATLEHAVVTGDAGLFPERERELLEAWLS